ncbi:hypothetical protein PRMUPPPA20_14600 [Xylanibacter ruminicola]|uniref:NgoPII restriction endonuclease n=2 Tax=Xylanibacter ruminicola TaxID=839 RepID=A0AA37ML35_XYLRU|nr:NgoPII family restriction endonuclease [Xylanibacter ruminicola]ADE83600.1 prophage PRU01, putative type II restriction endonuclease [Xylanibacter ruminicola 23]GJG33351.1 hypothetical protein PRMUPPPA20_14600 [Xylanibacter ruminicola]SEI01988.1 NgoPII restriction endonuclease [Xylanibacter ruminicola]
MSNYNIITAIINIIKDNRRVIGNSPNSNNRLHSLGEPLEEYIKDAFSNSLGLSGVDKTRKRAEALSYGGGKNNPPDAVLKRGAAIEVKKVESIGNINLNSSYPKSHLFKNDSKISKACREIENGDWDVKDIIYAIGCVEKKKNNLKSLALVYGSVYCASKECYENVFNSVKQSIEESSELDLEETKELAHINAVDPLRITFFRARGMWGISHPFKVGSFADIYRYDESNFELMAIIPSDKYNSFENIDELSELSQRIDNLTIEDTFVQNPNNTADLIEVKLVKYKI